MKKYCSIISCCLISLLCSTGASAKFALPFEHFYNHTDDTTETSFDFLIPVHERQDVNLFIDDLVEQEHFDKDQLLAWFAETHFEPDVLRSMMRPYEAKPWYLYRKHFIRDELIDGGVQFWKTHDATLTMAETRYGIPPNLIVAIIGVESHYGQNMGRYRVIDALTTLAFQPNPRMTFFREELTQFLLLCRDSHWNPLEINGSYAGAIGAPQFMPSSYRHYAVALQGSRPPDLIHNMDDAILSVANYLHQYGWHTHELIHLRAKLSKHFYAGLSNQESSRKPEYTVRDLKKKGLYADYPLHPKTPVGIIKLAHANWCEYWLGLRNFYVITRYNTSVQYAMAVAMLGAEINIKHAPPKVVKTSKTVKTQKRVKKHKQTI